MILRKPYAFLIKHFKMIHLILCLFVAYVLFQSNDILSFMNEYVATGYYNTIATSAERVVPITIFLAILGIIVISLVIYLLMYKKKKPVKVYIFNIAASVAFFVINIVMISTLKGLELETMELRTIRIVRDLYFALSFVNYPILIFGLIRGFGFDIKKFNFGDDIQELQIDVADSEEFEVTIKVDPDLLKRKVRRQKREFGYFVLENKEILLFLGGIIAFFVSSSVILNLFFYNTLYKERSTFNIYNVLTRVQNTYLTNQDYAGNVLSTDETFVLVKFQVENRNAYNTYLNENYFGLYIDGIRYPTQPMLAKTFFDVGEVYNNQTIQVGKQGTYLLVFRVPNNVLNKEILLQYRESVNITFSSLNASFKKVRLEPKTLLSQKKTETYSLGSTIDFKDSVLGNSNLTIRSAQLKDKFVHTFRYCATEELCSDVKVDILPNSLASLDKTILELDLDLNLGVRLTYANNKYDFIDLLGTLYYTVDGKEKKHTIAFENRTPKNNYRGTAIYIEVLEEVKRATSMRLEFSLRGITYQYYLKKEA